MEVSVLFCLNYDLNVTLMLNSYMGCLYKFKTCMCQNVKLPIHFSRECWSSSAVRNPGGLLANLSLCYQKAAVSSAVMSTTRLPCFSYGRIMNTDVIQ